MQVLLYKSLLPFHHMEFKPRPSDLNCLYTVSHLAGPCLCFVLNIFAFYLRWKNIVLDQICSTDAVNITGADKLYNSRKPTEDMGSCFELWKAFCNINPSYTVQYSLGFQVFKYKHYRVNERTHIWMQLLHKALQIPNSKSWALSPSMTRRFHACKR